ncbi:MAG TPA: cation-transporting P-type ATPase [Terrimicrobiaceae bacterium]|nr:cation-transporting P-type ATPase [Terrimicrobiaceae bacterium]
MVGRIVQVPSEAPDEVHHLSTDEAFASLQSAPAGLTSREAQRRLVDFGPNNIEEVPSQSLVVTFAKGIRSLLCHHPLVGGWSGVPGCLGPGKGARLRHGLAHLFRTNRHLTQTAGETLSPLQKEIIRLSRIVTGFAVSLGVIFFLVGQAIGLSFWGNFVFAIGIIVANVPEGLLPTVTLALAMGSQRMAAKNASKAGGHTRRPWPRITRSTSGLRLPV